MQKVIAVFVASLLLVPAGSFAQELKVNEGRAIGQGTTATAPPGTLRESAIRHARLVVAADRVLYLSYLSAVLAVVTVESRAQSLTGYKMPTKKMS